jgi:membrane associated rhomboid family serine protease
MGKVFTDIAEVFKRNSNQATQLLMVNLIMFFGFTLIRFTLGLVPDAMISPAVWDQNILTSSNLSQLLTHPWTLLFYPFTQQGLFSMIFDLLMIYWFGNMLADFLGGRKMIMTYLAGAFTAVAFYMVVWGIFSMLNKELTYTGYLYGASPGGFALMYAYLALNPESELMLFGIKIKTRLLVLAFLVLSIFRNPPLGVLDLGGAVFGYVQMKLLRTGINLTYGLEKLSIWVTDVLQPKRRPLFQKYPQSKSADKGKIIKFNDLNRDLPPSEEEVDHLLDKINKGGYSSLSNDEKNRLHKASQSAD